MRAATRGDWPLIRNWLGRPEIEDWWGPRTASEAAVMMAFDAPHAICRMIEASDTGEVIGYGHAVDATVWGDQLPSDLEPGTWDIDLFIASPAHRGIGAGAAALKLLRDEVFTTTLAVAVAVFASIANERAVRAYEKAGFRWKRVWDDPISGPAWFMTAERP
ncbi:MAG: GNAT family N-acetyltransferase [Hyphomicrobiaceae bacterium]